MPRQLLVSRQRGGIAVVEEDQVDIARIIEFAGAQLSHAQDREGRGIGLSAEHELSVAFELQEDRVREGTQATRGEVAELAGDAVERPDPGDVGDGDRERHAALQAPESGGDLGRYGARGGFASHGRQFGRQVGCRGVRSMTP